MFGFNQARTLSKRTRMSRKRRERCVAFCETLEPRALLAADPVLSEFVAFNTATIQDADGEYSDWIEIRNDGDQAADIGGFFLTNDQADPTRWRLPTTSIAPGESTIIFASGKNRDGAELHTNFTVDHLGGYLALVRPDGTSVVNAFADYPILAADQAYGTYRPSGDLPLTDGSDLRVLVPENGALGNSWTGGNEPFDDSQWRQGSDPVGFDSSPSTEINTDLAAAMLGQNSSAYLRFPFHVDDPTSVQSIKLDVEYDDGVVVYLNGREVALLNAPVNPSYDSTAIADAGLLSSVIDITPQLNRLRAGENILAVHGLNSSVDDQDFIVDVRLEARGRLDLVTGLIDIPTPGGVNGQVAPVITEFLAENGASILDEDGNTSDWIEIHNPGLVDFDLADWYLTDDAENLDKWRFPTANVEAGEYLIVFASNKDRDDFGQPLHTDFKLSAAGDYLALVHPDGTTVRSEYAIGGQDYTGQFEDVSYGLVGPGETGGPLDPIEGLVAYWSFEEGSGNTSADASGNGFAASLNNMDSSSWVSGRDGSTTALVFDGVNDFVSTTATASDLGFPAGTPRTVAGWLQGPEFLNGTDGGVFEIGQGTDTHFAFRNVGPVGTTWSLELGGENAFDSTGGTAGSWFHFAVSYDGTTARVFIDGTERESEAVEDLSTDDLLPFTIGRYSDTYLIGGIDEIAVWDMALPAESIRGLADETLTPLTVPTVNRKIGAGQDGFEVRQVNASPTFPGIVVGQIGGDAGNGADPLADSDKLLTLPPGDPGISADFTFDYPLIDFYDSAGGGPTGLFSIDEAFPFDDFLGDDDQFALRATADLIVPVGAGGDFVFAVHSDEGSRLRIDGADIIVDNALHAAATQQSQIVTLSAGVHELEFTYFERVGGERSNCCTPL